MKRLPFLMFPVLFVMLIILIYPVRAELIDKGGGLIYDTDLDITFLQDANYANTSDYDGAYHIDGQMQWDDAVEWAENLVYQGYDDWRLPNALTDDGSPCAGSNCNETEMLHLFIYEGISSSSPGPFINLQSSYWSQTVSQYNSELAITYSIHSGHAHTIKSSYIYAWAVRDGDSIPQNDDVVSPSDEGDENESDPLFGNIEDCFIATAAFGSPNHPHIEILREFRDRFMLTNSLGQFFVNVYYKHSPGVAAFISKHDTLRTMVRLSLMPAVGVTYVALTLGHVISLVLVIFLLLGVIIFFGRRIAS